MRDGDLKVTKRSRVTVSVYWIFLFLLCVTKICHIKLQALDEMKHFLLITVVALLLSCITFGVTINDPMSTDI